MLLTGSQGEGQPSQCSWLPGRFERATTETDDSQKYASGMHQLRSEVWMGAGPKRVEYVGPELWEVELAWATTVHKAQGSESKAVVVVLSPSHRPLLTRRLLYTGPFRPSCPPLLHVHEFLFLCMSWRLGSCQSSEGSREARSGYLEKEGAHGYLVHPTNRGQLCRAQLLAQRDGNVLRRGLCGGVCCSADAGAGDGDSGGPRGSHPHGAAGHAGGRASHLPPRPPRRRSRRPRPSAVRQLLHVLQDLPEPHSSHQACTNVLQSSSTSRRLKPKDDKQERERKNLLHAFLLCILVEHGGPGHALTLSPARECCRCTPVVYGNGVLEVPAEAIVSRAVANSLQQASKAEQQSTPAGQSNVHSTAAANSEVAPPKSAGRGAPSKFRGGLLSRRLASGSPAVRPQSGAQKWVSERVAGKGGLSDEDVAA